MSYAQCYFELLFSSVKPDAASRSGFANKVKRQHTVCVLGVLLHEPRSSGWRRQRRKQNVRECWPRQLGLFSGHQNWKMSYFSPHCKELEVSVRRVEYFYFQLDANGKYYNLDFRRQVCVGRGVWRMIRVYGEVRNVCMFVLWSNGMDWWFDQKCSKVICESGNKTKSEH